jgi:hypothetical protein
MKWCEDNRVPYIAWDDTKYEFEGAVYYFDGTNPTIDRPHGEGGIQMSMWQYKAIRDQFDDFGMRWLRVQEHFIEIDYQLTDCDISHLGAWPPPDPDEALSFDECEEAGVDGTLRSIGC